MNQPSPKVLFISDSMPLGGGSTSILNLCDGLRRNGLWEPHVAVFDAQDTIGEQIRQRGHSVHGPCLGTLHEDRMTQMLSICRDIQPQVVVAALGGSTFDFLRFAPSSCTKIAMIQSDDPNVYKTVIRYERWIDIVVGVSMEIFRKVKDMLGNTKTIVSYQPYGVPMPKSPSVPIRTKSLRVLYLGRLYVEQKRVDLMERIIRASVNSQFAIQWTIAGDGIELPRLRTAFRENASQVSFLGEIPYSQIPDLFTQNDVFFLCSDYEGMPLSMLESMGAGLVPVVSDLSSGVSEVVSFKNGMRVPIDDESGYLQALLTLAAKPDLLDEMAAQSIDAVRENFSIEAMTTRWMGMMNVGRDALVDWRKPVCATAPLELQSKIVYHPIFKPLRRIIKKVIR